MAISFGTTLTVDEALVQVAALDDALARVGSVVVAESGLLGSFTIPALVDPTPMLADLANSSVINTASGALLASTGLGEIGGAVSQSLLDSAGISSVIEGVGEQILDGGGIGSIASGLAASLVEPLVAELVEARPWRLERPSKVVAVVPAETVLADRAEMGLELDVPARPMTPDEIRRLALVLAWVLLPFTAWYMFTVAESTGRQAPSQMASLLAEVALGVLLWLSTRSRE
jgi:hypothetical protein